MRGLRVRMFIHRNNRDVQLIRCVRHEPGNELMNNCSRSMFLVSRIIYRFVDEKSHLRLSDVI